MHKSLTKIKDILKVNKPNWNEKYKVWVVRLKTKNSWKAVWRKSKEDAHTAYEFLVKKVELPAEKKPEAEPTSPIAVEEPVKTAKPSMIMKMFSKGNSEKKAPAGVQ